MSFMKWSIRELRINMTTASLLPAMCMTVSVAWGSLRCARGQTVSIHLHQASDGCQFAPHAPCISLTVNRQAPLSWQDEGKIRPLKCFLNRPFIKPGRDSIVVAVFGWNQHVLMYLALGTRPGLPENIILPTATDDDELSRYLHSDRAHMNT